MLLTNNQMCMFCCSKQLEVLVKSSCLCKVPFILKVTFLSINRVLETREISLIIQDIAAQHLCPFGKKISCNSMRWWRIFQGYAIAPGMASARVLREHQLSFALNGSAKEVPQMLLTNNQRCMFCCSKYRRITEFGQGYQILACLCGRLKLTQSWQCLTQSWQCRGSGTNSVNHGEILLEYGSWKS